MIQGTAATVIRKNNKAGEIIDNIFPDYLKVKYKKPSDYVNLFWQNFINLKKEDNNINGIIFEYILATLCIRERLLPLYLNAKVAFVPNVIYDFMLYSSKFDPICWMLKTNLKNGYKQADLEAIALKYMHTRSICYLITLEKMKPKW